MVAAVRVPVVLGQAAGELPAQLLFAQLRAAELAIRLDEALF